MHISFNPKIEGLLVFLVALFLMLSNIWGYPITILDEAKNAEAAREMFLGNHLLPTFNDVLRSDKPPLHYFFMQLGYAIFGVNELGARFFGGLLGAGFISVFYLFLRQFSTINIARIATFILLSAFFWVQEFHLAVPDPYLLVFLCSAWMFFYAEYQRKESSQNQPSIFLWLFYIFVGLATLAKGPIAIALTGLICLVFLILKKQLNFKEIKNYRPILGGLLVLLISLPWFIYAHLATEGTFTTEFFVQHNLHRFGNEMEGHGGIFLVTWAFVLLGLFPFGAFIPQGLWHGWKFLKRNDLIAYAFIISVVVIAFFSISSTKLPNYTLPAIPFLAILIAGFFEEISTFETLKKWWNMISLGLITLVSVAIPIAIFALFDHPLILNYQMRYVLIFSLIISIGLYFVWKHYLRQNMQQWIMSIGILWMILGIMIFYLIYPNLSKIEPVSQASEIIEQNQVVVFENYDPAFNFNYQRTFQEIHGIENLKKFVEKHPDILIMTRDRRLTRDRSLEDKQYFKKNFQTIFNEPSPFDIYRTVILKKW